MSIHDGRQDFGSASPLIFPNGFLTDAMVNALAAISASKLEHSIGKTYSQSIDAVVAADTGTIIHIAHNTGSVEAVRVGCDTAPTGGDLAYTVDVQKSTAGGAWATILAGVVTIDSSDADRTVDIGSISGTVSLIAGDMIRVVVAVSGSTGTQGSGVCVDVLMHENGQ
jgi:hypothetical protein